MANNRRSRGSCRAILEPRLEGRLECHKGEVEPTTLEVGLVKILLSLFGWSPLPCDSAQKLWRQSRPSIRLPLVPMCGAIPRHTFGAVQESCFRPASCWRQHTQGLSTRPTASCTFEPASAPTHRHSRIRELPSCFRAADGAALRTAEAFLSRRSAS